MAVFADPSVGEALVEALNANPEFEQYTRWFDGSVLLESQDGQVWLKVYRGKVIDQMPFMPPLGYTFKLSGSDWAWGALRSGERLFVDLLTPGLRHFSTEADVARLGEMAPPEMRLEGNVMEAGRITEAVHALAATFATVARQETRTP